MPYAAMKIWNIGLFCALVASLALTQEALGNSSSSATGELLLDYCFKLDGVADGSLKTIITTADVVNFCSEGMVTALSPTDGTIFFIGLDQNAIELAASCLNAFNGLYFNAYNDLPESVENLYNNNLIYSPGELVVKAYTTSQKSVTDKLRALILDSKYDQAVDISIYLYRNHNSDGTAKKIITKAVNQILNENAGYQIMAFAYKLSQNEAVILIECFPGVYTKIFNDQGIQILNKEGNGILRLSEDIDYYQDRWLYSDCVNSGTTDRDTYWKFTPTWNRTLNSVVFQIKNPFRGMKLKLDVHTLGHFSTERVAWGDHREVDPHGRFSWRLMPVGFNSRGQLLFRLDDVIYSSCLSLGTCFANKEDVKGSKLSCTTDEGTIFKTAGGDSDLYIKSVQADAGDVVVKPVAL